MARIPDCHPEQKHEANGLCKKCYNAGWRAEHPDCVTENNATWRADHPDYARERSAKWRADHPDYAGERSAQWRAEHPDYNRKYVAKRRASDIQYRLASNLRSRISSVTRREINEKSGSAIRDLGCSLDKFMIYIENQFEPGMSWNNYGEWHLDHVQPLASFELTDRSQFLIACHWLNYQPLWAKDNWSKGHKRA